MKITIKGPSTTELNRIMRELERKAKREIEREVKRRTGKSVKWVKK